MYKRLLESALVKIAQKMPVIGLLGPRQSGKTTLAKSAFPNHAYLSLENFDNRELTTSDPKRFLKIHENKHGLLLDEIQHVPKLLSYIQTYVDEQHRPGYIVFTGSQNILLNSAISQTLAGRIALFTLLPFSVAELKANNLVQDSIEQSVFTGGYPRIYAYDLDPSLWYQDYSETYVERDVRQILAVANLSTFKRFIRLCAGRIGQILNVTSLANDCDIDQRTAKAWLSVLEASYIIFLLQPHYENFSKRLIKSPKLYFYDTGLACSLLSIQSVEQLHTHYLRGGLIESFVISDILKHYYNSARRPNDVFFWRDQTGHEIDVIIQQHNKLMPIEIKAGTTISKNYFDAIQEWQAISKEKSTSGFVVYGGKEIQERSDATIISWQNIDQIFK